ncbi:MAG: A24 family peptidase [Acidimicrobiales bacterium]
MCGLLGLCVGSFLNVVIYRVPRRESVVRPRSKCPTCETPIAERDNIPVVSWLLLRGRCRSCKSRIRARYPLVELASAALFVAAGIHFSHSWALPAYCVFFASLLAITVIDFDHFIIPNRVIYPTLFITAPLLLAAAALGGDWVRAEHAAMGGVAGFVALFAVHVISPRGMGFGDVRLAGVIGMMLGWLGLAFVALALFLSFLLASVIGIGLMVTRIKGRKEAVPFGPFMAAGALIAALWGRAILDAYLGTRA